MNNPVSNQIEILKSLHTKQPHIITYYGYIIIDNYHYLIMEYCQGGSIQKLIDVKTHQNDNIDENLIWKLVIQILLGFQS